MTSWQSLHDGWFLSAVPGPEIPEAVAEARIPATVPGCVHTDLLAAGLIPDPYLDDNERTLAWIGRTDWRYETTFAWAGDPDDDARVELVCAGLDTVATITLNDVEVGRTANMHRGYRFDVRPLLRVGADNVLRVRFDSAYRYAEQWRDRLGDRPNAYPEPFHFIRKMACNFGWDWGPTLVTAGIWQEIGLRTWRVARLAEVRPLVTVATDRQDREGRVEVHVEIDRAGDAIPTDHTTVPAGDDTPGDGDNGPAEDVVDGSVDGAPVTVRATVAGETVEAVLPPGQRGIDLTLTVADPELWWPRGYGDQPRYPLEVTLHAGGAQLDSWQRRIGFRSVRVDTTPDEHGTPFTLVVNDRPIFARGVNWIPDDCFPTRVTRARYAQRFDQAVAANVNFLRVWGGGRYESEDFYDLADSHGLLVAQDFLFACAAYPEEEPFASEVRAEAAEQVVRLASHPSLVAWFGNNENIWGWHDWDWQEPLAGRSWGAGYYFELLPGIVAELDPTRAYWPGSPWSGSPDRHPNDPAHGTTHIWDVWNQVDYLHYRDYRPRFVAEFGYQGPATYATLRRAIGDGELAADSAAMAHRQKAGDGDLKLARGLAAHLPEPRDFDDWHYLTQVNQARAISVGVEHLRSLRPICMGSVVWQLNDCWPVTSWAAVDGDGRRKPLWYALRHSYADRLLTVQPRDGKPTLVAVNDGGTPWTGRVEVTRLTLAGEPRAKTSIELDVPAYSSASWPLPADLARPDDPRAELLLADPGGTAERAFWFFAEDRELAYPQAEYDTTVEQTPDGVRVRVTARTVLRDLVLAPDRLDPAAVVDEALVTLLPGESTTFTVRSQQRLDPAALTARPVLRCVNDLVARE
ncbi:glycoside hydrolase family 2 protein [Plantactinospora sp. B5E13]|uniref:glycoside hydrolase family 2 protein n=1 Tax=Plantactinospora sp. B5E13 TaxID=3153758 RepID=UPI00325CFB42